LSIIQIHPDFRLQGQSFKDRDSFLNFVSDNFFDSYEFLRQLLDGSDNIVAYTSGSTGKPKQIILSKKALLASAEATGQFFNLFSKTTALNCLSSDFIAGKMMWVRALHLGWHLEVVAPDKKPLLDKNDSFDFCAMVPMQVRNSLERILQIKKLIIGGAVLSKSLESLLKEIPIEVYQTYGMTETITHIAVKQLLKGQQNNYQALPNVKFSVDNRNCLLIDAPRVSSNNIVTNDVVQLHSPTSFSWLGRYDNVINSGGVKLFPEQIENKLAPLINVPFFISSIPDIMLGNKLILVLESDKKIKNSTSLWEKARLSKFEVPKEIYYLPKFSYTKSQKIERQKTLRKLI
jgi:O-succinylbenzoic acid--CoA ligase